MSKSVLEEFKKGDGAHRGLSDWYPKKEHALAEAVRSGKPFDTGWYASKHEIASARIYRIGPDIHVEVSVSDDFDTNGVGQALVFGADPKGLEQVREAISRAWDEADKNQRDSRPYAGYSILKWSTEIPDYRRASNVFPRERRKRYPRKQASWVDTYLVSTGGHDTPPGDNYYFWGWQSDPMDEHPSRPDSLQKRNNQGIHPNPELGIPKKTQEAFEAHARKLRDKSLRIGDWEIKPWDDGEE